MNQEQFKSFWDQLKVPLKTQWTKLTDEDLLQIDGNMLMFNGVIDMRYGERKLAGCGKTQVEEDRCAPNTITRAVVVPC